jgi:hypothetical protein
MRNYPLFGLFLLLNLVFSSCEKTLELEQSEQARLVVISNFTDKNDLVVFLPKSQSILSTDPSDYVTEATVIVFEGTQLLEVLEFVPADPNLNYRPSFQSKNLIPEVGKVYTITVNANGFEPVSATSSIPVAVPIQEVVFDNTINDNEVNKSVVNFNVSVSFTDPPNTQNYYHLVFYQELLNLPQIGDSLPRPANFAIPIQVESLDPAVSLLKSYDERSFFLKDESFKGKFVRLNFRGRYTIDLDKYLPGKFFVELRSVSEDYYYYHTSLSRQVQNKNPLSEGVVIPDNIINGAGIFAGYSTSTNSFSLSD